MLQVARPSAARALFIAFTGAMGTEFTVSVILHVFPGTAHRRHAFLTSIHSHSSRKGSGDYDGGSLKCRVQRQVWERKGDQHCSPEQTGPQRWSAPQDRDHGCSCPLPSTHIGLHSLRGSELSELRSSQNRARPRLPVGCVCDTFCGLVSGMTEGGDSAAGLGARVLPARGG